MIVAFTIVTATSRADFYYNAGAGDLYLRRTNEASAHLQRGEARLGWQFNSWFGLEASAYGSRGTSMVDLPNVTPPIDPAINVSPAGESPPANGPTNTVIVWNRYDYPVPATHIDASGFAFGPVFSVPVSPNLRLISRQKILRSRIREWNNDPYARTPQQSHQELAVESSLGVNWKVPHHEHWELGAEVLFSQLSHATMTTLLGSISYRPAATSFTSPEERQKLYLAAGAGPVVLHWATPDAASVTVGREFVLGWKVTSWLAGEAAALDCGAAVNNRQDVETYRWNGPFGLNQTTYITRWRLTRKVSAASLGPRLEWPLGAGFTAVTRQQLAVVTLNEWNDQYYTRKVHRSWVYRPGLGLDWQAPGVRWLKLKIEGSYVRTARVSMTAWLASAAVEF